VPIDPQIASSFALLEGITSYREAIDDPEKLTRIAAALGPAPGYVPPPCRVHDTEGPGPHGPVPVRVYRPEPPIRAMRRDLSGLTAAASVTETSTCRSPTWLLVN
jgi:acetyl esterase/lipase